MSLRGEIMKILCDKTIFPVSTKKYTSKQVFEKVKPELLATTLLKYDEYSIQHSVCDALESIDGRNWQNKIHHKPHRHMYIEKSYIEQRKNYKYNYINLYSFGELY